jgi:hypothetical protein
MVSIAVSLFGVRDVTLSAVNLSLWLIGMIGLVAPSIWIRKRAASVADQMEWVQWSFTPESISRRVETQEPAERLWRSVAECVRMPDGFVLRFRLGARLAMQWLPLDGFGNREDAAAFSELVQCKVKKYRTQGMTVRPSVRAEPDSGR